MNNVTCPALMDITNEDQCLENFAGLGSVAYFFLKEDINRLQADADTPNVYKWLASTLKASKRLFKCELKSDSQSFTGENNGPNKGFKITGQLIISTVNEKVALFLRALNNRDFGVILPDGEDKYQILYSPKYKVTMDAGSLKTETGAASSDDRITTIAPVLTPVKYANLYVTFPEGKSPEDYCEEADS